MTVTHVVTGNVHDLGGFSVARVLPQASLRTSGRSSSSTISVRPTSRPGTASTSGRIRTSGWRR